MGVSGFNFPLKKNPLKGSLPRNTLNFLQDDDPFVMDSFGQADGQLTDRAMQEEGKTLLVPLHPKSSSKDGKNQRGWLGSSS